MTRREEIIADLEGAFGAKWQKSPLKLLSEGENSEEILFEIKVNDDLISIIAWLVWIVGENKINHWKFVCWGDLIRASFMLQNTA